MADPYACEWLTELCRVTLPVRAGVERSLLCFQVPEKSALGKQIPEGAITPANNRTRNILFI
jgi:hypothetical protein